MTYKLHDNQNQGTFETQVFATKEDVRKHLYDFHSNDCELNGQETLEHLLDLGDWDLIEIK